ncbi:transposase [Vibrio sp. Vb1018]|uniref:transposase n=1 Tax=Vibrio sp. Vb1018 TaxID=3074636 RepID=UPI002964C76E|nr:transposase [Vibrio sp. Vb1018]MDW1823267.1 transposase [Vibrio sp. Vb1018]
MQNISRKDIIITCVNELNDFPDAINIALPNTQIQLYNINKVRNLMKHVPWKDYKAVSEDLKVIYQSKTEDEALLALEKFSDKCDGKYPQISCAWTITHRNNFNALFS